MATISISVQEYGPHDGPVLVWSDVVTFETTEELARQHLADLARRRRGRNVVRLTDGLEFDSYTAGYFPPGCPEMAAARTRVTVAFGEVTS